MTFQDPIHPALSTPLRRLHNGAAIPTSDLPVLPVDTLWETVRVEVAHGARLSALFALPAAEGDGARLFVLLARDSMGELVAGCADVPQRFPALTSRVPAAHRFEREIAEQWGVVPVGHPWFKPVRFHAPYRGTDPFRAHGEAILPGVMDFYRVEGEGIHEVAVGPVHAGVIEPGHFRFQCLGEEVLHLEIALGYQHRGLERALTGGPHRITIHQIETLAGDTTAAHTMAYCQALEGLAGLSVPLRAEALRAAALELERLANHTGDLGALAGDVAYLPTSSFCGRIRGDYLNLTAILCGNRFARGLIRPGGTAFDLNAEQTSRLQDGLNRSTRDMVDAVELLFSSSSSVARFEEAGIVSRETAMALGLVGVAARASGVDLDVRRDHPAGLFREHAIPVAAASSGDVHARTRVRYDEARYSADFLEGLLQGLPEGPVRSTLPPLRPDLFVASLVEGWRGEVCHIALTDSDGRFLHYKVVDPSFHNWTGLAMALRGQPISDFPLCNKSFNLSYCGHDL